MAKVSNLRLKTGETLMELALNELNKRADKMEKKGWKGKFKFQFEHDDLWYKDKLTTYTIEVKFEFRGYMNDAGSMKQKFRNHYVVFVNTCTTSKESLWNTYVHEITHVSQKFNNFLEYSHTEEAERYKKEIIAKRKKSKVSIRKFYNNRHHENLAEQEAVLSTVLQLLKDGKVDSATKYMIDRHDYFNFEWREFILKAYSYGVSKENIIKAKESIVKAFDTQINICKEKDTAFSWEEMSYYFVKKVALMNMFGLGNSYLKATYELGNKIHEDKPEFKLDKRLSFIKEQLEVA